MWRGVLHGFEVYLTGVGTQSGPALEGFLVIKLKKKKKKREEVDVAKFRSKKKHATKGCRSVPNLCIIT
jgi:hypothetical protein